MHEHGKRYRAISKKEKKEKKEKRKKKERGEKKSKFPAAFSRNKGNHVAEEAH